MKNKNRGFVEEPIEESVATVEELKADTALESENIGNNVMQPKNEKKSELIKYRVKVPLNVRTGPSISSMPIDVVLDGRIVRVYEENNGWGRIGADRWINLSPEYTERV